MAAPKPLTASLGNGITLVNAPTASNNVAITLALRRGTRLESADEAGLTRLCTSLLFAGTAQTNSDLLAEEIDSLGINIRSTVGIDGVAITLQGPKDVAARMASILSDALSNPRLDPIDMAAKKAILVDDIAVGDRDADKWMERHIPEVVYAPGTSLSRPRGGDPGVIKRASRSSLLTFHQRLFDPRGMGIIVAGGGTLSVTEAEKLFGGLSATSSAPEWSPAIWNQTSNDVLSRVQSVPAGDRPQSAIMAVSPGISPDSSLGAAAEVLLQVLSGGMSARLFYEVRERRALCYHIRAEMGGPPDGPQFALLTLSHPEKIAQAIEVAYRQLQDLAGVNGQAATASESEIRAAKHKLQFARAQASETANGVANYCATRFINGKKITYPLASKSRWDRVDSAAVQAAAQEILRRLGDVRLVQTGPSDQAVGLQRLIQSRMLSGPAQELAS